MSVDLWTGQICLNAADEATMRTLLRAALQDSFPDDQPISSDHHRYTIVAGYAEWLRPPVIAADGIVTDAGELRPGYWAALKINCDPAIWSGYTAALQALQDAGAIQSLNDPSLVYL